MKLSWHLSVALLQGLGGCRVSSSRAVTATPVPSGSAFLPTSDTTGPKKPNGLLPVPGFSQQRARAGHSQALP